MSLESEFLQMKQMGHIPADSKLVDDSVVKNDYFSMATWKSNQGLDPTKVVCDNPVWVAIDGSGRIHSSDGEFLYLNVKGKYLGKHRVEDGKRYPVSNSPLKREEIKTSKTIKFNEEVHKMDVNSKEVQDRLNAMKAKKEKMTKVSMDGKGAKTEEKALDPIVISKNNKVQEITKDIENVKTANALDLKIFNAERGTLVGYIMDEDQKVTANKVLVYDLDATGKKILLDSVSAQADVNASGAASFSAKDYVRHSEVKIRHAKPRKVLGMVINMPTQGVVPYNDLNKEGQTLEIQNANDERTILVLPTEQAALSIARFFDGGKIKEDPLTHPEPGFVRSGITLAPVKGKEGDPTTFVQKVKLTPSRGVSNQILPTNYIPRKVFKTVKFSEHTKSEEMRKLVDESLFYPIALKTDFEAIRNNPVHRAKTDDVFFDVTSDYTNPSNKKPLEVTSCFGGKLVDIEIPVKTVEKTKKGDTARAIAVTYDVMRPKAELENLNPLVSDKFKAFREAALGQITQETFVNLVPIKEKSSKTSKSKAWSAAQNDALLKAAQEGTIKIDGIDASTFEALDKQIRVSLYKK